jgi:hypothetical protein
VGAHEASRVCQLEEERTCKTTADCVVGLICGSDGACRDHCESDRECVGDQVCNKGVCAEPDELDESGNLPRVLPLQTCRLSSDCDAGQRCVSGNCIAQCLSDRDCAPGETCAEGACAPPPRECQDDDECSKAGQSCVAGACRCECLADVDCAAGESCDGCACQAGPPAECTSAADCADGKQCLDGACACRCVEDRDCPETQRCDGCNCVAPPRPTSIHDATLADAHDIALMQGITDVETRLYLYGSNLSSTLGLEALQSVGSLQLSNLTELLPPEKLPNPFAGLANLTTIRGDFSIANVPIGALELNPALSIGGNVSVQYTSLSCASLETWRQQLIAHGFTGTLSAMWNGGCSGACSQGACFPVP